MKETGIIMSGNHPKLILDGIKTMTRRVIVPQPNPCRHKEIFSEAESGYNAPSDWGGQLIDWIGYKYEGRQGWFCYICGNGLKHIDEFSAHGIICPYGQVGDRLWVRETWRIGSWDNERGELTIEYRAGGMQHSLCITDEVLDKYWLPNNPPEEKWRPSIFMPRWASRILLEITDIRAERLQEITPTDCIAEGIETSGRGEYGKWLTSFKELWDSLNAKRGYGWEVNPWVWIISFRRIEK